jgi:ribosome modulation factor
MIVWKGDGEVSYAYEGAYLVGVVRDWSMYILGDKSKPWQGGWRLTRGDNLSFANFATESEAMSWVEDMRQDLRQMKEKTKC